jgi:hypothetical protein
MKWQDLQNSGLEVYSIAPKTERAKTGIAIRPIFTRRLTHNLILGDIL